MQIRQGFKKQAGTNIGRLVANSAEVTGWFSPNGDHAGNKEK